MSSFDADEPTPQVGDADTTDQTELGAMPPLTLNLAVPQPSEGNRDRRSSISSSAITIVTGAEEGVFDLKKRLKDIVRRRVHRPPSRSFADLRVNTKGKETRRSTLVHLELHLET